MGYPRITAEVRPVMALAELAVLVWALAEVGPGGIVYPARSATAGGHG